MKKILLTLAFVGIIVFSAKAQTILSQTNNLAPAVNTISCNDVANQLTYGNSYYRAYTMPSAFTINSVKIGVGSITGIVSLELNLYKSSGAFPASYPTGLTLLSTILYTGLSSTNNLSLFQVNTSPIATASGDIIVVEVKNVTTTSGNMFSMGAVSGAETDPAYFKSDQCGFTTPVNFSSIASGANVKIPIDLSVVSAASSPNQLFAENFNLYPNPTTDILNISSKNGLEMEEIKITDLSARIVRTLNNVSTINVSDLSAGTYLIDITTKEGKASSKFIKR